MTLTIREMRPMAVPTLLPRRTNLRRCSSLRRRSSRRRRAWWDSGHVMRKALMVVHRLTARLVLRMRMTLTIREIRPMAVPTLLPRRAGNSRRRLGF